jgi:hypothetical protein
MAEPVLDRVEAHQPHHATVRGAALAEEAAVHVMEAEEAADILAVAQVAVVVEVMSTVRRPQLSLSPHQNLLVLSSRLQHRLSLMQPHL